MASWVGCGKSVVVGGKFGVSHNSSMVVYGKWKKTYMKERDQEDDDEEKQKYAFCFVGLTI